MKLILDNPVAMDLRLENALNQGDLDTFNETFKDLKNYYISKNQMNNLAQLERKYGQSGLTQNEKEGETLLEKQFLKLFQSGIRKKVDLMDYLFANTPVQLAEQRLNSLLHRMRKRGFPYRIKNQLVINLENPEESSWLGHPNKVES
ncbi:MAG: hypothetical protein CL677_05565 [Bdellovibrionaceae bacterium]|nr:hypothetical protein [Pseudobdellovibrionaceae bacterium]|tara:strand:+ start:186 stop:626 length:441 start_codon:yes stop_codon:yes gene_type:complete